MSSQIPRKSASVCTLQQTEHKGMKCHNTAMLIFNTVKMSYLNGTQFCACTACHLLPSLLTYLPKDSNTTIRARSLNVFFGYLETYRPTTQNMFCFALWLLLVNLSRDKCVNDLRPNYFGGVFWNICRSSCKALLFFSILNQNLDVWNWSNFMKIR